MSNQGFHQNRKRLIYLEKWFDLAIRPDESECLDVDRDILNRSEDDL